MTMSVPPRTIRLLDLDGPVARAASRAGLAVSDWIRMAIRHSLDSMSETELHAASKVKQPRVRLTLRLDRAALERWREEAQEEGMSLNRYVELQLAVTGDARFRVAGAVELLAMDAAALGTIGRSLAQIVRACQQGRAEVADQSESLRAVCRAVDEHRAKAGALVRALREGESRAPRGRS